MASLPTQLLAGTGRLRAGSAQHCCCSSGQSCPVPLQPPAATHHPVHTIVALGGSAGHSSLGIWSLRHIRPFISFAFFPKFEISKRLPWQKEKKSFSLLNKSGWLVAPQLALGCTAAPPLLPQPAAGRRWPSLGAPAARARSWRNAARQRQQRTRSGQPPNRAATTPGQRCRDAEHPRLRRPL